MSAREFGLSGTICGGTSQAARHRLLDVAQADGADFALHLRDDVRGLKPLQDVVEDPVDGQRVAHGLLHQPVDLAAVAIDGNARLGADGK